MKLSWALKTIALGLVWANVAAAQLPPPPPGAPRPPMGTAPTTPPTQPPTQQPPAQQPPAQQPPAQQPPAQQPPAPPQPAITAPPASGIGSAIPGLTADQLAAFNAGNTDFQRVETAASGLGPFFNDNSCVICHRGPAPGGSTGDATRLVTRFGRITNGEFDGMYDLGGSLLQNRSIDPRFREVVPTGATIVARRLTTPTFGLGLLEAIPDATIQAGAAATKPDNVRGKVAMVLDIVSGQERVGRFGWKNQHATILAFTADAYLNEMGITNRFFATENAPNGNVAQLNQANTRVTIQGLQDQPDPNTGLSKIDRVTNFMRFLAPPPQRPLTNSATAGQALFTQIGCAVCHTPSMQTGPSPVAALSQKPVRLYSDLLLHDMGVLGDGIAQGAATGREMRTAPLWGLRSRPLWLHDGRARTIPAAITAHDGEAAPSRVRYQGLNATQRTQLLDFLNSI